MNALEFALYERDQFVKSKTWQAIVAMEVAAIGTFVEQVINGQQGLDFASLKGWLLLQGALVLVALLRHTMAGIEAKLNGAVDPAIVKAIESSAINKLVGRMPVELASEVLKHKEV